jgi:hypothetical protein
MAASVHGVRDRVDGILAQLDRTDEEARAAAQGVADQFRLGSAELPHDQDETEQGAGAVPPTGPTPVVGAASGAETGEETATPSVDELFARIRAGTAAGQQPVPTAPAAGGDETASGADHAEPAKADAGDASDQRGAAGDVVEGAAGESSEEPVTQGDEVAPGPDDSIIARRDELLTPIAARLGRTIKRTLGDDQNRLLDRLRSAPASEVGELMGSEDEHLAAFAAAARSHLDEAFAAGTIFVGAGAATIPRGDAVEQSSAGLARAVVTNLRRLVEEGVGDPADRIGAAFREWRGERVERLVGDQATQAFSAGVAAASADGKVRWVVTTASGCSDCEDNALGGAVSGSEAFPTGHAHPPAHSGCRCLITPATD